MNNGPYYNSPPDGFLQGRGNPQQQQQYPQYPPQTPQTPQNQQNQQFQQVNASIVVVETKTQPTFPGQVDHSIPPINRSLTGLTSLEQVWRMPLFSNGKPTWKFWFALALLLYIASIIASTCWYVLNILYYKNHYYNYYDKCESCPIGEYPCYTGSGLCDYYCSKTVFIIYIYV